MVQRETGKEAVPTLSGNIIGMDEGTAFEACTLRKLLSPGQPCAFVVNFLVFYTQTIASEAHCIPLTLPPITHPPSLTALQPGLRCPQPLQVGISAILSVNGLKFGLKIL